MTKVSSILIATFSPWKDNKRAGTNGMIDPMLYYFLPRYKKVWLLDQPYPGSDKITPIIEIYNSSKLIRKKKTRFSSTLLMPFLIISNKPGTHIAYKIRDILSVIEAGFISKNKFDLFIGLESINTIGGIFLRKIGKVRTVAYYVSDYSPNRFKFKFLNGVYLWLDKYCAEKADFIWDVSPAMQPARIKAGLNPKKSAPVINIPNALFKEQIDSLPYEEREKNSIVFVGTLGLENGPDLAIKAISKVIKKIPEAKLHIFGGGGKGFEEEYLKKLVVKLKIEKDVIFHGFFSNQKELSNSIKHYQLAIAPYKMIPGSIRLYGDATKLRLYMASGLPVICTDVPPLGKEIAKRDAAIIVKDSEKEIAEEIIKIFKNEVLYKKMVKNAVFFAKNNIWENTYTNALKEMNLL